MEEIRNIIELIYHGEQNILDEKIKQINFKLKDKIKKIDINEILGETEKVKEMEKMVETIEENYSIKMAEYNREFYQQGFIDGVNLIINCLKK